MALTTDQEILYDRGGTVVQAYVYIDTPPVLFSAPITAYTEREGAYIALVVGTPTVGTLNDIGIDKTLYISHGGGDKNGGSQRVRSVDIPQQTIYIGRSSAGREEGQICGVAGAVVTVYDDARPFVKAPYIAYLPSVVQYKDEFLYPGDNEAQPPIAIASRDRFIVSSNASENVPLSGSLSHAVRAGATITGYSWDIRDGSVISGSTTAATLTVSFPRGRRLISLTVTDSNGRTHTTYRLIVVARPIDCYPAKISYSHAPYGNSLSLELQNGLLSDAIPPRAKVLVSERENYTSPLIEYAERFSGWLQEESASLQDARAQNYVTEITIEDVAGFANRNNLFPQSLNAEDTEDVGGWFDMKDANIDRMTHYIWFWHTSVLSCCSFLWSGQGSTYPFPKLTTSGGSFWQNVDRLARSFGHELTVSPFGELKIVGDPHVLPTAAQATEFSLPTQRSTETAFHFYRRRYQTYTLPAEKAPQNYWSTALGIVATNDLENVVVVGCVAPSNAPGFGMSAGSRTDYLTVSQEELNIWKANEFAAKEGSTLGDLVLKAINPVTILDLSTHPFVTVDLPTGIVTRYDLSGRWTVESVQYGFSDKGKTAQYVLRKEIVAGKPARTMPQITDDVLEQVWDGIDVPISGGSVVQGFEGMSLTQAQLEATLRKTRLKVYLSELETDANGNSDEDADGDEDFDPNDTEDVFNRNAERNGGYWEISKRLIEFLTDLGTFYGNVEGSPTEEALLITYITNSLLNPDPDAVQAWVDYILITPDAVLPDPDRDILTAAMYCEESASGGMNDYILNEVDGEFWDRWFTMSACISEDQYAEWFDKGDDYPLGSFTGYECYTYPPVTLKLNVTQIHAETDVYTSVMDWSSLQSGESRRFMVRATGKYEDDDYIKDSLYVYDKTTEEAILDPLVMGVYYGSNSGITMTIIGTAPPYNTSGIYTFSAYREYAAFGGGNPFSPTTSYFGLLDDRSVAGTGVGNFAVTYTDLGTY